MYEAVFVNGKRLHWPFRIHKGRGFAQLIAVGGHLTDGYDKKAQTGFVGDNGLRAGRYNQKTETGFVEVDGLRADRHDEKAKTRFIDDRNAIIKVFCIR